MMKFCFDCQDKIKPKRYFMVHNHLWEEHGVGIDFLCVDCFENRLGRRLTAADLIEFFVNEKVNNFTAKFLEHNWL